LLTFIYIPLFGNTQGEIEAAVEEATSAMSIELDESYDRCDELSKANVKLKKQVRYHVIMFCLLGVCTQ